ncbi:hypothetical protein [Flagellimonas sp.]|uniref:hypothetical protein n=1 Tax=Flagellimonas sp. TaxID=2058762 RepID=UPI003BAD1D58
MATKKEVETFLREFKTKLDLWEVLYRDDRGKNLQALVDLELRPSERKVYLKDLVPTDYSQGPLQEKLYAGADMWVFGKIIKNKEVYIKITLGAFNSSVVCISFHISEYPMNYPLKSKS